MAPIKLLALLCAATTSVVGQTFITFPIVTPTTTRSDLGTITHVTRVRPIVTPTGTNPGLGLTTIVDTAPWDHPPVVMKAEATASESVSASTMSGSENLSTVLPPGMTIQTSVPASTSVPPGSELSSSSLESTAVVFITSSEAYNITDHLTATEGLGNKTVTSTAFANSTILPTSVHTIIASHFGSATASSVPGSGAGRVGEAGFLGMLVAGALVFLSA
jgi:hypothetical protein